MSVDLEPLKARLENAHREPYQNRKTITIEIALLVKIIKELEQSRKEPKFLKVPIP
jgi:hypothetical protein